MIRDICKDEAFLAQKSQPATLDDLSVGQDLLDTLAHHKEECVGMAANMIGVNKRIIVFDNEGVYQVMYNPRARPLSGDCDLRNRQALFCIRIEKAANRRNKIAPIIGKTLQSLLDWRTL